MSFGYVSTYVATMASAASTVSFQLPKAFRQVFVELPTMSTAAVIDVYGSPTPDGTYRPVFERVNTAPVQYQALTVATGVGANGGCAPINVAYPNVQLRATSVVNNGMTVKLICWD